MAEPVANGELPRWTKPDGVELSKPRVNNSLTNEKTVLEGSGPKGRRCEFTSALRFFSVRPSKTALPYQSFFIDWVVAQSVVCACSQRMMHQIIG